MKRRHAVALGIGLATLAALSAHTVHWYLPRERETLPSPEALAWLGAPGWSVVAWVPFPHQNLGLVERRVGDLRRWLAMVLPPGRSAAERLPRFGPWLVPPAHELVVAQRGAELAVDLDVYPTIGLVARASGWLARNPWLAGGEVALGGGRRAVVGWEGGRWRLRTAGAAPQAAPGGPIAATTALARLHLSEAVAWLPVGDYHLQRGEATLELRSGRLPRLVAPPLGGREPRPAAWIVERGGGREVRALVLWEQAGAVPPFPAALALERGAVGRLRLPGEELLRVAGGEVQRSRVAGFELRAFASAEIEAGGPLAAELAALLGDRRGLALYAGLRPERIARAARRLAESLRGLPLGRLLGVDPERLAAWLGPLADCPVSVLEVRREPPGVRWQICLDESPPPPPR